MARRRLSFTFCWPMNSSSRCGRSESSTTDSSERTSGVVISARDIGLHTTCESVNIQAKMPSWNIHRTDAEVHPDHPAVEQPDHTDARTVASRSAARFSVSYFLQKAKRTSFRPISRLE